MDKKTILKVFGEAFLRSMVVLMGIVIVGFSAFFIMKVNADKKKAEANALTTEAGSTLSPEELQAMLDEENAKDTQEDTQEDTTEEEIPTEEEDEVVVSSKEKKVLVLNATGIAGLARKWMDKLSGEGFTDVATGNYSLSQAAQTRIYVPEEGMGKDLAEYFTDAVVEVGSLSSGIDVSTDGVDIFIILGSNDTTVQ